MLSSNARSLHQAYYIALLVELARTERPTAAGAYLPLLKLRIIYLKRPLRPIRRAQRQGLLARLEEVDGIADALLGRYRNGARDRRVRKA